VEELRVSFHLPTTLVQEHLSAGVFAEESLCNALPGSLWSQSWIVWEGWTSCLQQNSHVAADLLQFSLLLGPTTSKPTIPSPGSTTQPPHTTSPPRATPSSGTLMLRAHLLLLLRTVCFTSSKAHDHGMECPY